MTTLEQVELAANPEDLFGPLSRSTDKDQLKKTYRQIGRRIHPDRHRHSDQQRYSDAFARLGNLYNQALQVVDAPDVTIQTKRHTIVISGGPVSSDGVTDTYNCQVDGQTGVIKIATGPSFNDLMENEVTVLGKLRELDKPSGAGYLPMLPLPLEDFLISDRRAVVYSTTPGAHSLAEVHDAYPGGIDAKTMAWMWRQLLDVLGYTHSRNIIHGAVLPHHISIYAEEHRLVLTGWRAAVDQENSPDAHVPVIDEAYRNWYPPEILAKQAPTPATDIYLAAATMIYLLGADPTSPHAIWPVSIPPSIRGFLISCLLPKLGYRPQSSWTLRSNFTELIEQMWGPRKFHPFHMPAHPGH